MSKLGLASLILVLALPAAAQTPQPTPPEPQPPAPSPAPAPPEKPKVKRFFFGGGVGLSFGDVDSLELSRMVGMQVVPGFDVGLQPFYRWVKDTRYSPDIETSDYGASIFARFLVIRSFYLEADYQYT